MYLLSVILAEYNGQVNGDVNAEPVRHCDVIRITGKEDNCSKAKQALLDLVPITIDVDVPFELHRSIIGQKVSFYFHVI